MAPIIRYISLVVVVAWMSSGFLDEAMAQPSDSPNIVIITADNLGYGDIGVYGNEAIKTPNLDRLAGQGVRLTSFYTASPTCTVSRAALLTGRYPQRTGLNHQLASEENLEGIGLPHEEKLLPEYLKEAGYATGAFGKWNLGFAPGSRPTGRGFDEFYGHASGNIDYYTHIYGGRNDLFRDTTSVHVEGYKYSTDMWTEAANEFIERHADESFFLYLPYNAPHYPAQKNKKPGEKNVWQAPDEAFEQYGYDPYVDDPKKRYRAVVTALDAGIGRVLDKLEELELQEETLVIFFSDNGAFMLEDRGLEVASNAPFRDGGVTVWEGGIRVPAMVRWPGSIEAGTVCRQPVMSFDLFTLALEVAGAEVPEDRTIDGKNPLSTLQGKSQSSHDHLFWEYRDRSAVRGEQYKLIRPGEEASWELYDLSYDAGETQNLADEHPAVVKRLKRQFQEWIDEVGRVDYPN